MALSKEQILAINDFEIIEVDVPKWGGTVHIKPMSGKHREAFEQIFIDDTKSRGEKLEDFRALLCVYCICDEGGNLIFDREDVNKLSEKSSVVLDMLADKCQRVSKLNQADADEILGK